jgi:hypothetical protein
MTYRPKVTPRTTEDQLFDIFCQMLDPLDDGHVELEAKLVGIGRHDISALRNRQIAKRRWSPILR